MYIFAHKIDMDWSVYHAHFSAFGLVCIFALAFKFTQPSCHCVLALSQTRHAIISVGVTASEAKKHNCVLSGALHTRGFKVMKNVVRVLVTTLAFSTQPHTSRALSAHYPYMHVHTGTHTYTSTHTMSSTMEVEYADNVVYRTNENIL